MNDLWKEPSPGLLLDKYYDWKLLFEVFIENSYFIFMTHRLQNGEIWHIYHICCCKDSFFT